MESRLRLHFSFWRENVSRGSGSMHELADVESKKGDLDAHFPQRADKSRRPHPMAAWLHQAI